ncbi:hypothetical protein RRG08_015142 [Elysia crispata]|uniref:G-protein coupled receptors family 1 profile domain-containing protein n=1 Tax=Elysia crispata TaxID=231223 RepID=A0AAE0ZW80_9GAST|nr:hypothetical protein RRG08_015142 [Elysia crispata]
MKFSISSSCEPYDFSSALVSTTEHVNNILTSIPNQNQTPFPENTSVTPFLRKNGNFDGPYPPLTAEEFRRIVAVIKATQIQVGTIFSIALVFGLPGSVLALVTLSSMAVSPMTRYMSFLAISDFAALLITSLSTYRIIRDLFFIQLDYISIYVTRIFQAFSHWNLALICVERFVSVRYPFQKSRLYTRRATFLSVGAAFTVSLVPFPGSYLSNAYFNFIYKDLEVAVTILFILIYMILPGGLIIIFTILTARHLRRSVRHRETIGSQSEKNSRSSVTMETQLAPAWSWVQKGVFEGYLYIYTDVLIPPAPLYRQGATNLRTLGPMEFLIHGFSVTECVYKNLTLKPDLSQTPFPNNTSDLAEHWQLPSEEEKCQIKALLADASIQAQTIISIALIFGLPGSVLALVTLSSMEVSPTKRYMSFLAISDFAALLLPT